MPVTDLGPHIALMEGFHKRYMVSSKVLHLWVRMARQLDIAMLVPQHGSPIQRKSAIGNWQLPIPLNGWKTWHAALICLAKALASCPLRTSVQQPARWTPGPSNALVCRSSYFDFCIKTTSIAYVVCATSYYSYSKTTIGFSRYGHCLHCHAGSAPLLAFAMHHTPAKQQRHYGRIDKHLGKIVLGSAHPEKVQ